MATYFMRMKDDALVQEFCVAGATDPNQTVETRTIGGTLQKWARRWEGDLLVFHPPDGYDGQGLLWHYDRRLQTGHRAGRDVMFREALRNQVSG